MALREEQLKIVDLEGLQTACPEAHRGWVEGQDEKEKRRLEGLKIRFAEVPSTGAWVLIGEAGQELIVAWNPGQNPHGWTFYEYYEEDTWREIFGNVPMDSIWDPYHSPLYD